MKYLVLDTAGEALAIGAIEGEYPNGSWQILAQQTLIGARKHGETLAAVIDSTLKVLNWRAREVAALIVGCGPGSFTGVRIGITYAKTWAQFNQVPLYTVSSLGLLAVSGWIANAIPSSFIVPVIDGRRGTAYTGLYRYHQEKQQLIAVLPDTHCDFDVWLDTIQSHLVPTDSIVFVGHSLEPFEEIIESSALQQETTVIQGWGSQPRVAEAMNWLTSERVDDIATLAPNYTQQTLAEREWQAAHTDEQRSDDSESLIDRY